MTDPIILNENRLYSLNREQWPVVAKPGSIGEENLREKKLDENEENVLAWPLGMRSYERLATLRAYFWIFMAPY